MKQLILFLSYLILGIDVATASDAADLKPAPWKVALTFDDILMSHDSSCTLGQRKQVQKAILDTLQRYQVHSHAFMVTDGNCSFSQRGFASNSAQKWLQNGHAVGQQSATLLDLNKVDVQFYLKDLTAAHQSLLSILEANSETELWFRAPYLHRGNKLSKKATVEAWLSQHKYHEAPVTIDSKEEVYARAYDRAMQLERPALADLIVEAYLEHLKQSAHFYRNLSHQVFHRDIPQILRLRVNQLNADHLDAVLTLFQNELSVSWIDIDTALSDSAYASEDEYVGNPGLSWIFRWGHTQYLDVDIDFIPQADEWVFQIAVGASMEDALALKDNQ